MIEKFKTIMQNETAEIEEKKSRFIANIFCIQNVNEAEECIQKVKKKFFDARHHCYAYRIIEENGIKEKQSDDGEPSGTAGGPILNILTKSELCQVLVIVTRYFGGTLLGTGGLVRAYSEVTLQAIQNSTIVVQEFGYEIEITIDYKDLEKFKFYCHKNNICITNITYETNVTCNIEVNLQEKEKLITKKQSDIKIIEYAVLREKYIKGKIENT